LGHEERTVVHSGFVKIGQLRRGGWQDEVGLDIGDFDFGFSGCSAGLHRAGEQVLFGKKTSKAVIDFIWIF
jgi:hypothetical protein